MKNLFLLLVGSFFVSNVTFAKGPVCVGDPIYETYYKGGILTSLYETVGLQKLKSCAHAAIGRGFGYTIDRTSIKGDETSYTIWEDGGVDAQTTIALDENSKIQCISEHFRNSDPRVTAIPSEGLSRCNNFFWTHYRIREGLELSAQLLLWHHQHQTNSDVHAHNLFLDQAKIILQEAMQAQQLSSQSR